MENEGLLRRITFTPICVDDSTPITRAKIDHSIKTSPRCVRLRREQFEALEHERARYFKKVSENSRRLSIS